MNILRSEWTKLWTLRSTLWTSLLLVVVTVGISAIITVTTIAGNNDQMSVNDDPTAISLAGLDLGMLIIVVLGVMAISTEYATGSIRTSLIAVPRRITFLGAKAVILGAFALAVGLLTSFASFFVGQAILAADGLGAGLGDPGVFRAVVGGGLYLAGSAMFGFALGAVLRSTAAGISAAIAGLFVLPQLAGLLPGGIGEFAQTYFTSNAGRQVMQVTTAAGDLGPWTGYLVYSLWWAVPLLIAAILMRRRDV